MSYEVLKFKNFQTIDTLQELELKKQNTETELENVTKEIEALENDNRMLKKEYFDNKDYEIIDYNAPLTLQDQPMSYGQIEQCKNLRQLIVQKLQSVEELKEQIAQTERRIQMQEWELEETKQMEQETEQLKISEAKIKQQIEDSRVIEQELILELKEYESKEQFEKIKQEIQNLRQTVISNKIIGPNELNLLKSLIATISKLQQVGRQSINSRQQNSIMSIISNRNTQASSNESTLSFLNESQVEPEADKVFGDINDKVSQIKQNQADKLMEYQNDYNIKQEQQQQYFQNLEKEIKEEFEKEIQPYKEKLEILAKDTTPQDLKNIEDQLKNLGLQYECLRSNLQVLIELKNQKSEELKESQQQFLALNLQKNKKSK